MILFTSCCFLIFQRVSHSDTGHTGRTVRDQKKWFGVSQEKPSPRGVQYHVCHKIPFVLTQHFWPTCVWDSMTSEVPFESMAWCFLHEAHLQPHLPQESHPVGTILSLVSGHLTQSHSELSTVHEQKEEHHCLVQWSPSWSHRS